MTDVFFRLFFVNRFLWRYVGDELDVYKWTGKNDYVALCEAGYLFFGSGYVPIPSRHTLLLK